uniref:Uncharacterized protein n=1 Tax=Parastrongyloides trichosuri TaxID=131310 RepID=A0A0N4Z6H8_PARTI
MSEGKRVERPKRKSASSSRKWNFPTLKSLRSSDLEYEKREYMDKLKLFFDANNYERVSEMFITLLDERNDLDIKLELAENSDSHFDETMALPKFKSDFSHIFEKIDTLSMEKHILEIENRALKLEAKNLHEANIKRLEPLLEKVIKCPHCCSSFTHYFDEDEKFNNERFEKMTKTFSKGINASASNIFYIPVVENGQIATIRRACVDEDINDGKRVTEEWLKKIKHSQKSTKPYHMLISDRQRRNRNIKMLKAMYKANAGNKIDPETIDYIISETGYEGQLKFSLSIEELTPIILHHKFSNRGLFALKALIDGKAGWKVFPTRQQIANVRSDPNENPNNDRTTESPNENNQGDQSLSSLTSTPEPPVEYVENKEDN